MVSQFYARRYPAGREFKRDQLVPNDTPVPDVTNPNDMPPADGVPASSNDPGPTPIDDPNASPANELEPTLTDQLNPTPTNDPGTTPTDVLPQPTVVPDSCTSELAPPSSSPHPTATDCLVSSSTMNYPQPTTTPMLGIGTIQSTATPTPTAALPGGGALSTSSSTNKKYIIGGAAGGGALLLILLALLLFCCRKRRAKRDLERSSDSYSEEQLGHGQFVCCNHGTCTRNNEQPHMEQKTPLKPFVLRSDPVAPAPGEDRQEHPVSLTRRDSAETQKSAGSDSSTSTTYSSDSEDSRRGRRRSRKRPPPLKLTSLVTPIINGPQHNPRNRANRSSLPNPHEVPAIVVEPPQSETPERMRRR